MRLFPGLSNLAEAWLSRILFNVSIREIFSLPIEHVYFVVIVLPLLVGL